MRPEHINQSALSEYAGFLIDCFYSNNFEPIFDALDENVIIYGSVDGKRIESRQEFILRIEAGRPCELGPVMTIRVPHGLRQCDTVSTFNCYMNDESGKIAVLPMLYHMSWVKKDVWKISVVTATGRPAGSQPGSIQPGTIASVLAMPIEIGSRTRVYLHEKGTGNALCIAPSAVEYIEGEGHYSKIHMGQEIVTVTGSLKEVLSKCGTELVQCHSGFAVNPLYVQSIERFAITLVTGMRLPVPEKKYTAVKRQLEAARAVNKKSP